MDPSATVRHAFSRISTIDSTSTSPRRPRPSDLGWTAPRAARSSTRAGAALALSIVLAASVAAVASGASAGSAAAVSSRAGLDAPIHAFDWPAGAPNDPYYTSQADLTTIDLPSAWLRSTGVPDVVVAVLDTGIDATHPEFAGRLVPGYDALTLQADSAGDFGPTNDDDGHGTHVSGTIGATTNNGQGIAGIAPNVSIMPVKVLDSSGGGDFEGMVAGMNWAIGQGARIITMSFGGTLDPAGVANVQQTFDAAYAAGVVVVAASGNDSGSIDEYPCNFAHVICVGSTISDGTAVSSFSTRTPGLSLVAPGEDVVSTVPGNAYATGTGTSMATPHVTGAVALLRSIDPAISVDQVLADLTQTARPLAAGGRNADSGYGLLQVGAALDLAAGDPGSPTPSASPAPSPSPGGTPLPSKPTLVASTPGNGARNALRSIRPRLTFSVPMTGISTRTITMIDLSRGRNLRYRISYSASSRVAVIVPAARLAANHSYRIVIAGIASTVDGLPLNRTYTLTFRTGYR